MTARKKILVTALICAFALLLATAMHASVQKAYFERPFRVHGDATVLIDWANPQTDAAGRAFVTWTMTAAHTCTEGWFKDTGAGVLYLDTLVAEGSGECCECNGDALAWESVEEFGSNHVTVTFVGGTGQLEDAMGGFSYDYTTIAQELDDDGNPVKLTYSYWGEGAVGQML